MHDRDFKDSIFHLKKCFDDKEKCRNILREKKIISIIFQKTKKVLTENT